jgi:uracil permease
MGRQPLKIKRLIGLNLILDGVGDAINGTLRGCADTNFGENNSIMVITRNYSAPTLVAPGIIAIFLGCVGKLAALVGTLPVAVTGGLAVYLFGAIGLQGVARLMAEKVDLFDPKQLAMGATSLVARIGDAAFEGGQIPIFGTQVPSIASAALAGIFLNAIFLILPETKVRRALEPMAEISGAGEV